MTTEAPVMVEYVLGPQQGLGPNRNHALSRARGSYVLFLDDDCLLGNMYIEAATRCMRDAEAISGTGRVIVSGSELQNGRAVVAHEQTFLGFQGRPYRTGDTLKTIVINATLFPAGLFDSVRFDPQLRYGLDEVDVATRAVAAGFRIVSAPEAQNDHRPSPTGREDYHDAADASRLYITARRYTVVERRFLRAAAFAVLAPAHLVASRVKAQGVRRGSRSAIRVLLDTAGKLRRARKAPSH